MLAEKLSPTVLLSALCEMPLSVVAAPLFGSHCAAETQRNARRDGS